MTAGTIDEHLDPYLSWAIETNKCYLVHREPSEPVRVAGELRKGHELSSAIEAVNLVCGTLVARRVLETDFFTGILTSPTRESFDELAKHARFVLAEPGMNSVDPTSSHQPSHDPSYRGESAYVLPEPLKTTVVVGVIDGPCGFANLDFGPESGQTWLDAFWDQGAVIGSSPWTAPAYTPYGRELDRQALTGIAGQLAPAKGVARVEAEQVLYRSIGHIFPADADWSHGSHVLSTLLAAWKDLVGDCLKRPDLDFGLLYVQLPESALRDTSGRWAAAWVLDATEYIVGHAAENAKVVINLSLGAFAGPHDGSSLVERFVDAIAQKWPARIAFVIAAGNAGRVVDDGTGSPRLCHARFVLEAADGPECNHEQQSATLIWDIDAPDSTESFLEIWVPEIAGLTPGEVEITLESEGEPVQALRRVGPGPPEVLRADGEKSPVIAMVSNCTGPGGVPNGRGGMALVALAHTSDVPGPSAPRGRWRITVKNRSSAPLTVDAWIERRDIPGDLHGIRPQYGFASESAGVSNVGALGSLANGRHSIVVGSLNPAGSSKPNELADYSSEGFGAGAEGCNARAVARRGPDVYSPGRRIGTGYFSGCYKRLDGTSIAAAQVSGAMVCAFQSLLMKDLDSKVADPKTALDVLEKDQTQRLKRAATTKEPKYPPEPIGLRRMARTSAGGFEIRPIKEKLEPDSD